MFDKIVDTLAGRVWIVYGIEAGMVIVLILYGILSQNGFSAKGY